MAFENLVFIIKNYWKHGYKNIIVTDLREDRITILAETFKTSDHIVISLVVMNDEELKNRVLGERDSGVKNVEEATEWNRGLISRHLRPHEHKIDNTERDPAKAVKEILGILRK